MTIYLLVIENEAHEVMHASTHSSFLRAETEANRRSHKRLNLYASIYEVANRFSTMTRPLSLVTTIAL